MSKTKFDKLREQIRQMQSQDERRAEQLNNISNELDSIDAVKGPDRFEMEHRYYDLYRSELVKLGQNPDVISARAIQEMSDADLAKSLANFTRKPADNIDPNALNRAANERTKAHTEDYKWQLDKAEHEAFVRESMTGDNEPKQFNDFLFKQGQPRSINRESHWWWVFDKAKIEVGLAKRDPGKWIIREGSSAAGDQIVGRGFQVFKKKWEENNFSYTTKGTWEKEQDELYEIFDDPKPEPQPQPEPEVKKEKPKEEKPKEEKPVIQKKEMASIRKPDKLPKKPDRTHFQLIPTNATKSQKTAYCFTLAEDCRDITIDGSKGWHAPLSDFCFSIQRFSRIKGPDLLRLLRRMSPKAQRQFYKLVKIDSQNNPKRSTEVNRTIETTERFFIDQYLGFDTSKKLKLKDLG